MRIAQTKHGVECILTGQPRPSDVAKAAGRRPRVLVLADLGWWRRPDLGFLDDLRSVEELRVTAHVVKDLSGLERMTWLRELRLHGYCSGRLNVGVFTELRRATIDWNPKFHGLEKCRQLKALCLHRGNDDAVAAVAQLPRLRDLEIVNTNATRFAGVWRATRLRRLRLALVPRLNDRAFRGIRRLTRLQEVEVGSCSHVSDLTPIAGCSDLRRLLLETRGVFASLAPLSRLKRLEELYLSGRVADGDLSVVVGLPRLRVFSAPNRKDYSPTAASVDEAIRKRAASKRTSG